MTTTFSPGYPTRPDEFEPALRHYPAQGGEHEWAEAIWTLDGETEVIVRTKFGRRESENVGAKMTDAIRTVAQKLGIDVEPKAAPDSGAVRPDDV